MKKICILSIIIIFALTTKAQFLINENFSSGLPTGWTNTALQGTQSWTFKSSPAFDTESDGQYVVFDDFTLGAGTTPNEASLETNSFNCTGRTQVNLKFHHYWQAVEFTHGYVEVWDGTTWNEVADYETTTQGSLISPVIETIDITAHAAGNSDVKVRFRYTDGGQYGRYWYIDDVKIYSDPDVGVTQLVAPVQLVCGNSYTATENVTVRIFNYGFNDITGVPVSCDVTGAATYNLTGTYVGTITAESYIDYTFTTQIDMTTEGWYNFVSYTTLGSDTYSTNNSNNTTYSTNVASFPYNETFTTKAGWYAGAENQWEYGTYTKMGGNTGWVTTLSGDYSNNADWYLYSPIFDLADDHIRLSNLKVSVLLKMVQIG